MWPRLQLGGICPHIAKVVYLKQRTEQRTHLAIVYFGYGFNKFLS
jgi:hypothetical protein